MSENENNRWANITRPYSNESVKRLRGSLHVEHTLARHGAERLWKQLHTERYINALGALTGNQAVQMVRGGLQAIYLSGWQVAADANSAGQTYPDQSLYPYDSVPTVVRRINRALQRSDQIQCADGSTDRDWFVPIVADAEAGFGGPLNAFELMKAMIEAGAAGVHFEDQLSSEKKCGHLGGKVLVPTSQFIRTLIAARLASDVLDVPTILVARTDADSAKLLLSDADPVDHPFIESQERTPEGFYHLKGGIDCAISRARSYAPYADMIWCETAVPDIKQAREFARGVHEKFPGKLLAYNCSPSFNWQANLNETELGEFRERIAAMGFKFQFITLAGWHALNLGMFELSKEYLKDGMLAYSNFQQREFANEPNGFRATKHQTFVGTGYFDAVQTTITNGVSSTTAMEGSTEEQQFQTAVSGK